MGGFDIPTQKAQVRSQLGILVENAGLYSNLTDRECIEYVGKLHGIPAPMLKQRIEGIIDDLGMGSFSERRTAGFSRGMPRKVMMGGYGFRTYETNQIRKLVETFCNFKYSDGALNGCEDESQK